MHRVHREATERMGANWLGRNRRWKRGLAYRRTEETALCSTGHGRNRILFIGRGLAYRKMDKMDLLRWKRGPVDREGCGVPQNGTPRDTVHLHRRPPPASTGYRRPPPASTGSCSSSLHRALLHRLLFNHPSPRAPVQPPLHGLLFIHPSIVYCSSSPPWGRPVHPALHGVLFIQPQPARSIGVLFIQRQHHGVLFIHPHRELFIQTPQQGSLFIQRQHRSTSVSSSSEGITRVQLTARDRSIARVQ